MPNVSRLNLSHNQLESVVHLQLLVNLTHLDLSYNTISHLDSLHTKLGNLKSLNVMGNKLESMQGLSLYSFSKLFSLQVLNLSNNEISQLLEVKHVSRLPCLENLLLIGNPVVIVSDYRTKVLEMFGDRTPEVTLDNTPTNQEEYDTVSVRQAIQKARDSKHKKKTTPKKTPAEVPISDIERDTPDTQSLDSASTISTHTDTHPTHTHLTHTPGPGADYRSTVETIRNQGGEDWLSILNKMRLASQSSQPYTDRNPLTSTPITQHSQPISEPLTSSTSIPPIHSQLTTLHKLNQPITAHVTSRSDSKQQKQAIHTSDENRPMNERVTKLSDHNRPMSQSVTTPSESSEQIHEHVRKSTESQQPMKDYITTKQSNQKQKQSTLKPVARKLEIDASNNADIELDPKKTSQAQNQAIKTNTNGIQANNDQLNRQSKDAKNSNVATKPVYIERKETMEKAMKTSEISSSGVKPGLQKSGTQQGGEETQDKSMFIVPENLPSLDNYDFHTKLKRRLLITDDEDSLKSGLPCTEKITDSLWCYVIQYTYPGTRMPACVTLTDRHIFIQHLRDPDPEFNIPELETYYIMPVFNIHQIVIGHCWSYVRLQESFVGPTGTFTIIGFDTAAVKEFVLRLRSGLQPKITADNIASQTDVIDLSVDGLASIVSYIADLEKVTSDDIKVLYFNVGQIDYYPACLVVTEKNVYIFRNNCGQIPPPTYELSKKVTSQFELLQSHSIMAKISDLQMYDLSSRVLSEGPFNSCHEGYKFVYEEYGISMLFHEDGDAKPVLLDVCLPTVERRSEFLEMLTQIRSAFARNLSPMHREEPEGCTEICLDLTVVSTNDEVDADPLKSADDSADYKTESPDDIPKPTVTVEEIGIPSTPNPRAMSLNLSYPSNALLNHLNTCLQSYNLLKPIPEKLEPLSNMASDVFVDYFHSNLAQIGQNCEQLCHILWTNVVPYKNPRQELISCVILTTKAVYLISDDRVIEPLGRHKWQAHSRNKSDTFIRQKYSRSPDHHNSSGIVLNQKDMSKRILKPYKVYELREIRQINFGVFDQCLRLTGSDENSVYTLLTRDFKTTDELRKQFIQTFTLLTSSPVPEITDRNSESDFYSLFRRSVSAADMTDYPVNSKTRFRYPTEEVLSDWSFIIKTAVARPPPGISYEINFYVLGYFYQGPFWDGVISKSSPRSIVLTNLYLCLCIEDIVSYPIPEFARGLPDCQRQEITDIRKIELLKRVALYGDIAVTLIFSDEADDIVVDSSLQHFGDSFDKGRQSPPEVAWTLLIQSDQDRHKLVDTLCRNWSEVNRGYQLLVHSCDVH